MKRVNRGTSKNIFLMVLMGLFWGCASSQETATLQQSMNMLYERVQTIDRRLEGSEGQGQKSADLYSRLEELQMRVGALNGRIEELQHRIEQLARTQAQPPQPSASETQPSFTPPHIPPMAAGTPSTGTAPHLAVPPAASSPQPPVAKATSPPPAQPKVNIPERDPEKDLYDKASELFQQGQYEPARKEFQNFLAKYPKSERADNALFSVGECYNQEKRYQEAIEAYQKVLDRYPNGNRVPHALFKQGTAFQQLGDATAARILFERLVEKYPGTPQAQAAEKRLKQLQ